VNDIQRIVVIGLDGASWDILRPRMESAQMPNLKRFVQEGAAGDLISIYPPETPAAWPSFMTGKNPGKHGVFDFLVYRPETGRESPVNAVLRDGKTLWDYLSEAGKTSLVLNVPTTYPPAPLKGAMITGFLTPAGAHDYTYPRDLASELEKELGRYPLFFETMSFVCAASERNTTQFLDELEQMDRTKFEVAEKLFDRYLPDFTMLHIWGTDRLQHELWSFMDPEHPKYDAVMAERFGKRIDAYYQMLDTYVGRLAAKAGDGAAVFVISDHGFGPTHYFIDLNSWLLREGFIVLRRSARAALKRLLWDLGITPYNATRVLAPLIKHAGRFKAISPESSIRKSTGSISIPGMLSLHDVDWERTQAYAPFGWSGIYVNTRGIRPHGSVPPEEYEAVRDAIVECWANLKNPHTGELVGGPVHVNEAMYSGPYSKYGPDIMPLPLAGKYMPVCFFGFASKEPVYENNTLFGNHRMEGILLARGPGLERGTIEGARLIDLAPTFLYLLGRPVPSDMDGRVLGELAGASALARRPIEILDVGEAQGGNREGLSEEEEEEIRTKLTGLGYL
jgi:predicted AlkP superfamily phosphohydrolase/phosphomutase